MTWTPWQRAILDNYADGDFAHCESIEEVNGDTLLKFLLIETSVSEDCTTLQTAINRLDMATRDVAEAVTALVDLKHREGIAP